MTRMKMKDLEQASGVGRETIRFYIREGLLPEPQRPSRNVAFYDESFLKRLARIKDLQERRRLPLHVIKATFETGAPSQQKGNALREIAKELRAPRADERLDDLAARIRLPPAVLRELAQAGVIEVTDQDGIEWVDQNSAQIVELWAKLHQAGFTEELGYGPTRLALYQQAVDRLVEEELELFTQGIVGKVSQDRSVKMAEAGIHYMNQIFALMRRATLLRRMGE